MRIYIEKNLLICGQELNKIIKFVFILHTKCKHQGKEKYSKHYNKIKLNEDMVKRGAVRLSSLFLLFRSHFYGSFFSLKNLPAYTDK